MFKIGQRVKITAKSVASCFGIIVDADYENRFYIVKVGNKNDCNECLIEPHCIMLGEKWIKNIE